MTSPKPREEAGLRRAKDLVERLIAHTDESPSGSWSEGRRLGMQEVLYRLNMELHVLSARCVSSAALASPTKEAIEIP
jgi:hypothetical protein